MSVREVDVAIIGAGPAGLAASIEVAKAGAEVVVIDENHKPGGQLFKQIHKFFGSKEHLAGTRGYDMGTKLLNETKEFGVDAILSAPVYGVFPDKTISYQKDGIEQAVKAKKIILATGATENGLAFEGWTLPGVMGAGAAQTMINVNRVQPGSKVLMIGSGNVGLIVSYQLMQAGCEVVALIEGGPSIGGYGVHAGKISRAGVPIYVSHTIRQAIGENGVEGAEIVALDENWNEVDGSEKILDVDTICLAVGLNPLTELAFLLGCEFIYNHLLGGHIPKHDRNMESSMDGIYVAGDIAGVEEASSAMEEGRLAGIAAAESLGFYDTATAKVLKDDVWMRMDKLRTGEFGEKRRKAKEEITEVGRS